MRTHLLQLPKRHWCARSAGLDQAAALRHELLRQSYPAQLTPVARFPHGGPEQAAGNGGRAAVAPSKDATQTLRRPPQPRRSGSRPRRRPQALLLPAPAASPGMPCQPSLLLRANRPWGCRHDPQRFHYVYWPPAWARQVAARCSQRCRETCTWSTQQPMLLRPPTAPTKAPKVF